MHRVFLHTTKLCLVNKWSNSWAYPFSRGEKIIRSSIKGAKQQGDKTNYRLFVWKSTRQEEPIKYFLLLYTQICSKENTLVGGYPGNVSAPSGSLSCQSRGHVVNGNAPPGGNVGGGGAGTNNTGVDDNGEDSDELNDVMEVLTRYGHQMSTCICGSCLQKGEVVTRPWHK